MPDRILYILTFGFVLGIAVSSVVRLSLSTSLFFLLISLVLFTLQRIYSKEVISSRAVLFIALFLFSIGLGTARVWINERRARDVILEKLVGEEVLLRGIISAEPDIRDQSEQLTLDVSEVSLHLGKKEKVRAKALLITDLFSHFSYGDEILVKGKLQKPKSFETDSGRVFDYESYLSKDGIYYEFFRPEISFVEANKGNYVKSFLIDFKMSFIDRLKRLIAEPESSLLAGLLAGVKQSLGKDVLEAFRRVGIIHIIVLSGYNLTIVAEFFMKIFGMFRRNLRILLGASAILLFIIMVGASATVVRAGVMALLALLSRAFFRRYDVSRALAFAGIVMLLHNPKILLFDPSFQLSFLATIGLVYISPIVERYLTRLSPWFKMKEILVATISTQIFVTPFLLYLTGNLSLVSIVVNLLVLPAIPLAMFFGFLAGAVAFASYIFATPFAFVTHAILSYVLFVVEKFSNLSFATLSIQSFPFWVVAIVYFFIIGALTYYCRLNSVIDKLGEKL